MCGGVGTGEAHHEKYGGRGSKSWELVGGTHSMTVTALSTMKGIISKCTVAGCLGYTVQGIEYDCRCEGSGVS